MGAYGVKATEPGMICRGYQFKPTPYINECEKAQCAACGFHYAENPLDCLSYYGDMSRAEFWLVYGDGDMDEDARDSKITCTRIEFLRKLDTVGFLIQCVLYIHEHPRRPLHALVQKEWGEVTEHMWNRFVIVVGDDPIARGTQRGDYLCLLKYGINREADSFALFIVGEEGFKPGVWYDASGHERSGPRPGV